MSLPPEAFYALAEQAHAGAEDAGDSAEMNALTFRAIVERVTEALTAELSLPSFAEWSFAYREDPARFDAEMLGLWRERGTGQ
jgi:hypothetical protein